MRFQRHLEDRSNLMSSSMFASNLSPLSLPSATCSVHELSPSCWKIQKPTDSLAPFRHRHHIHHIQEIQITHSSSLRKESPATMSVNKLNKVTGLTPEQQIIEDHHGPSKTLKETIATVVSTPLASLPLQSPLTFPFPFPLLVLVNESVLTRC